MQSQSPRSPPNWVPGGATAGNDLSFRCREIMPFTRMEREYRLVLNEILIKPRWWTKVKNPAILEKWQEEARDALVQLRSKELSFDSEEVPKGNPLDKYETSGNSKNSEDMLESRTEDKSDERRAQEAKLIDRAVAFLKWELDQIAQHGLLKLKSVSTQGSESDATASPVTGHGVFISDDLIPSETLAAFSRVVSPIETVALDRGDWHSGTHQVLDLIHPSMHCLVYGRTHFSEVPSALVGETAAVWSGSKSKGSSDISSRFQWLPTDINVDSTGRATLVSYINNLDRRVYPRVYGAIKSIFQGMVPMFERAVEALETDPKRWIDAALENDRYMEPHDAWLKRTWISKKYGDSGLPAALNGKGTWYWPAEIKEEYYAWCDEMRDNDTREVKEPGLPDPTFEKFPIPECSVNLKGKTLQVIFKMATICLTPENPEFKGGNWHLEGMENEAIAATGLFYYDVDNITPSRLTFRHVFTSEDYDYPQSDFLGLEKVFGFQSERSDNVQWSDPTKPGYRRVLAMFLVHPDNRIISTSHVPPQQRSIIEDALNLTLGSKLPSLVVRSISGFLPTMSLKEAKTCAEELSEERSQTEEGGFASVQNIFLW
ncbi:hypothetical protein HDU93_007671 [Gonapodya sp. JEL0774]|nr:hypothetical protein HDU93_007671 [Gonapodya sp. JEL0774]